MVMDLLLIFVFIFFLWWLLRLPRVIKETKQDIQELDDLFKSTSRYYCPDCNQYFNSLKREIDTNGDEWVDICPNCGGTNYEDNENIIG